jgi:cephalosporin hydroxylase
MIPTVFARPQGIFICHWWHEVGILFNILDAHEIGLFVEIGVLDGGLAAMMLARADYLDGFDYLGFDNHHGKWNTRLTEKAGIKLFRGDAMSSQTQERVANKIRRCEHRAMVYCDGGNKALEAKTYWPYLRRGDLLGVHDFSDDEKNKSCECWPSTIGYLLVEGRRIDSVEGCPSLAQYTRILLLEKP